MLGIDNAVSDQWGRVSAIRPTPVIYGLLAATAMANGLTLVTRNDRDVAGVGAMVLNPYRGGESGHQTQRQRIARPSRHDPPRQSAHDPRRL